MEKEITSFYGEYEFLNNAYPVDVVYEGQAYPSVEHAYQASKFSDAADRKQFVDVSLSPRRAKSLGRKAQIRPGWNNLAVMEFLVRQKFYKNDELRELLMDTGNADIKMVTKEDKFWGVVKEDAPVSVQSPLPAVADAFDGWMAPPGDLPISEFHITDSTSGKTHSFTGVSVQYSGENHLGKILMKIRNEFLMEDGPKKAADIKGIEADMNKALLHDYPFREPIVINTVDDIGNLIFDIENEIDRLSNLLHYLYEAEEEINYELEGSESEEEDDEPEDSGPCHAGPGLGMDQQWNYIQLRALCERLVREHPVQAAAVKKGNHNLMGFFVGQAIMNRNDADPHLVSQIFEELLLSPESRQKNLQSQESVAIGEFFRRGGWKV